MKQQTFLLLRYQLSYTTNYTQLGKITMIANGMLCVCLVFMSYKSYHVKMFDIFKCLIQKYHIYVISILTCQNMR